MMWGRKRKRSRKRKGKEASDPGVGGSECSNEASDPRVGGAECKPKQYDVFINHRGPDVKQTFVAHLDDALRRNGFRPFVDAQDIEQGHHVFKSIDQALNGACVHVAIFSKRYAESTYCLNELCDMLKSGQTILPVFYHVNPEDLRRIENGPFKEGFEQHMKRGMKQKVKEWKEALRKVAEKRGFRLDEVNGNEKELIRRILEEVQNAMPATLLPAKEQYGMEKSMKDVLKSLESVSVLGLVGMGGIGKTTLAMGIYNHFVSCRQFDRYCFLKDVRSSELSQVQHNLLKDLGHGFEVRSPQDYKRTFDALISQRVLVVVDDIDDCSQFEALIPDIQKLGSGSRIVITSRQRGVLERAMAAVQGRKVYDVPPLHEYDSRLLFNRHAFRNDTPSAGFAELATEVADACGGIPLVLETIGASLVGEKVRKIWMETVKVLEENEEIFGKLRSTYDRLRSKGDQAMFRDIACMMIGMEEEVALTIWESCSSCSEAHCSTSRTPRTALKWLKDRSLVKVDEEGRLRMHDVLRDMGRYFVKEEARGSSEWAHLWDAASATKELVYKKTNTNTRGLSLAVMEVRMGRGTDYDPINYCVVSCEASDLAGMKELHLLRLECCHVVVPDGFSSWPQELRWLRWRVCCFASLPSHLNLPNLVVLDLSRSWELPRLWENDAHVQLPLLQLLDLSWCTSLQELAENIGESVPKLKSMVMEQCHSLRRLPDSIGHLTDLEHLDLRYCSGLVSLPDAIVGLVSLRTLNVYHLHMMQQLPEELGKLTKLETLIVSRCSYLSKLPATIGGLRMLKTLDMSFTRMKDLPTGFGLLTSLTSLTMMVLHSVPETFQGLKALAFLVLDEVSGDLGDLGALAALKDIRLRRHATITTLPKSLGNLKWLVRLHMLSCNELLTVEALPEGLEDLDLSGCKKLTEIPSLAAMTRLVHVNLTNCESLKHALECVTTWETVKVSGCTSIEKCTINGMVNNALRECDVSGSEVGVVYNNKWLEREPAAQVIIWLGNAIAPLSNSMAKELLVPRHEWTLVLEATIKSEAKCIALIWCLAIKSSTLTDFSDLKVEIWRGGQLVLESRSFPSIVRYRYNTVYLFTLRREHHVVQSLQLEDKICVYLFEWVIVKVVEGGVCVVHYNENEKLVLEMNSEMLNMSESEDLAEQFGQLMLEDKFEEDDWLKEDEWLEDECKEDEFEEDECGED